MQGVSGISGAAPILRELLTHLHEQHGTSWYAAPPDAEALPIHALTGQRLPPGHPEAVLEWFLPGTLPAPVDPADFDAAGRIRLPVEYRDWFVAGQHGLHGRAWVSASTAPAAAPGLRITQPVAGAVYVLDPDLPEAGRRLRLRAVASGPVVWQSATLTIHHASGRAEAWLTEGRHELVARDPDTGAEARTWIEVRRL
jgi:penicillin-binding protein 1C